MGAAGNCFREKEHDGNRRLILTDKKNPVDTTNFVTVISAKEKILKTIKTGKVVNVKLADAFCCILASGIKAKADAPPFHQSAMDGYAFRFSDFSSGSTL